MECIDRSTIGKGAHQRSLYDAVVEGWNKLKPFQRREREAVCREKGHDWGLLSWGPRVCKRCLKYDMSE